jgi:hypothetical protein
MDALMIVALVLQVFLLLLIVGVWVAVGMMPGRIAKNRGHPQADSINVCGWFGALTMGILAPIAFVWAFSKPVLKPIELERPPPPEEKDPEDEEEAES